MAIQAPSTVTVSDTTLYHLAAEAYGDPTQWTRIAKANRLLDPWVVGVATLVIPRPTGGPGTGGVLGNV